MNARDRIGNGPWYNARGQIVAMDKGVLHGDTIDQARVGNAMRKRVTLALLFGRSEIAAQNR